MDYEENLSNFCNFSSPPTYENLDFIHKFYNKDKTDQQSQHVFHL